LPTTRSLTFLRVVCVMGEVSFANAAAITRIGTSDPSSSRTLFASDARDISYVISSLSRHQETESRRLSVGVQTHQSQLRSLGHLSQNTDIRVCVLDLSRVTLVDVDGADALGTIGQHLARLAKRVREMSGAAGQAAAKSFVYVVVGNEAPKNLFSDMWLKSKLEDGMVFRSMQGAMRDWEGCICDEESIGVARVVQRNHDAVSVLDSMWIDIDGNFELEVFPDACGTGFQSEQQPSPSLGSRPMRNREGSFSTELRARQGSFHL
jgi:hypothetical protein